MKKLIVATSNPGKLREIQEYLHGLDWELGLKPPELEIDETGTTFMENAILKAEGVAKALNQWTIADDSGLMVDGLNGAPGIYSARYGNGQNDTERNLKLLAELGDNPNRKAQFVCAVAIARPDGTIALSSEGICQGEILTEIVGSKGFGYDPIFYVPQFKQTFAQMSPQLKNSISHRGRAFASLLPQLKQLDNRW
jgi:XTP/dITP diphosphohydrolase